MDSILTLFCSVDDLWQRFAPDWQRTQVTPHRHRHRASQMHPSEIMTILILFHQSHLQGFLSVPGQHPVAP